MDKKNTMLLTVIAVATLLVAVVGATFAYFSVTGTQSATTNVSASAGKIGAVNVTNDAKEYALKLTAQDMNKPLSSDEKYYAIESTASEGNDGSATGGVYSKKEKDFSIATISLSGAGENDTVKCKISVQANLSGTMTGNLKKGDLFITLSSSDYEGFSGVESFDFGDIESQTPKVNFNGSDNDNKTGTVTFTGVGEIDLKNDNSKTIKAKIWMTNKYDNNSGNQNYLADKNLKVTLITQVTDCQTTSVAGAGA